MIRKSMFLLATTLIGTLIARQWPDFKRYMKIRQMSTGQGHPENVPAAGSISYPQSAAGAVPDGTGQFDSARRGGPARAA
jgi:hypothetical protein